MNYLGSVGTGMARAVDCIDELTNAKRWDIGALEDVTGTVHAVLVVLGHGTVGQLGRIAGAVGSVSGLFSTFENFTYFARGKRFAVVHLGGDSGKEEVKTVVRHSALADLKSMSVESLTRVVEKGFKILSTSAKMVCFLEDLGQLERVTATFGNGVSLLSGVGVKNARDASAFFTALAGGTAIISKTYQAVDEYRNDTDGDASLVGLGGKIVASVAGKVMSVSAKISLLYIGRGNQWAFRFGALAATIGTVKWGVEGYKRAMASTGQSIDKGIPNPKGKNLASRSIEWVRDGAEGVWSSLKGADKFAQTALGVLNLGALNRLGSFMFINTLWKGDLKIFRNVIKVVSPIEAFNKDILKLGVLKKAKEGDFLAVVMKVGFLGSNIIASFQKMGGFGWVDLDRLASLIGRIAYVGPVLKTMGGTEVRRYLVTAAIAASVISIFRTEQIKKTWELDAKGYAKSLMSEWLRAENQHPMKEKAEAMVGAIATATAAAAAAAAADVAAAVAVADAAAAADVADVATATAADAADVRAAAAVAARAAAARAAAAAVARAAAARAAAADADARADACAGAVGATARAAARAAAAVGEQLNVLLGDSSEYSTEAQEVQEKLKRFLDEKGFLERFEERSEWSLPTAKVVDLMSSLFDQGAVILGPSASGTAAGALWDTVGGCAALAKLVWPQRVLEPVNG